MDRMVHVAKITAYKDDIRIDEQNEISLAISIIFEIIPSSGSQDPDYQRLVEVASTSATVVAIVFGALRASQIIASVSRAGGPLGFAAGFRRNRRYLCRRIIIKSYIHFL